MIAAVEHSQRCEPPKRLPERMKRMELDAGPFQLSKEGGRGCLAAECIVEDATIDACPRPLLQCRGNHLPRRIVENYVHLHPDALPGGADVGNERFEPRG